jgi:uroporphyrinogen III methyltransferase/synthase
MSLSGKRIIVTRALSQATELANAITASGGIVHLFPCIAFIPNPDTASIEQTLSQIQQGAFDWVLFTSENAIRLLHIVVQQYPQPFQFPIHTRIGVISTRSATLFHTLFQRAVDCTAPIATADSLEATVHTSPHHTYCWFTSRIAPARFTVLGNNLTRVDLYDTIIPDSTIPVHQLLNNSDLVTVTSPSCVTNFAIRIAAIPALRTLPMACMGNSTISAAIQHGFTTPITTSHLDIALFVHQIANYFAEESPR